MTVVFPAPSGPSIVINNPSIVILHPFQYLLFIIRYFPLIINQIPIRFNRFPSPLSSQDTIFKSTVITKRICRVLIVAVKEKRIKVNK